MKTANPEAAAPLSKLPGNDVVLYRIRRVHAGPGPGEVTCDVHRAWGVREELPRPEAGSPGAFEVGYAGEGPESLARAILAHHAGRENERALVRRFKEQFFSRPAMAEGGDVFADEISDWLLEQRAPRS